MRGADGTAPWSCPALLRTFDHVGELLLSRYVGLTTLSCCSHPPEVSKPKYTMVYRMETLSAKVPPDVKERIDAYAEARGLNQSQAIRRLVTDGLDADDRPNGMVVTKPAAVTLVGWYMIALAINVEPVEAVAGLGALLIVPTLVYYLINKRRAED